MEAEINSKIVLLGDCSIVIPSPVFCIVTTWPMMDDVANLYEREVTLEVEGLAAKIEPIMLVIMGALVLILALGIFLPMWELANAARGRH